MSSMLLSVTPLKKLNTCPAGIQELFFNLVNYFKNSKKPIFFKF
jgi:hypothetical protein